MPQTKCLAIIASVAAMMLVASAGRAQQPPPQAPNMTFFVTSAGLGKGADLGGLEGADRQCQSLAQAAGAGGKTWRAYLSTQAVDGATAVNARDRIGAGPWQNFKGEVIAKSVDELHGDQNRLSIETALTERGTMVAGRGYTPNYHDVLTGSQPDGRAFPPNEDRTCRNWSSSTTGAAMVGHHDRKGVRDDAESKSWNSSHPSRGPDGGCSQNDLRSTGGNGLLYCFAAN
jgi:Collagenase NC10 and Endostatin